MGGIFGFCLAERAAPSDFPDVLLSLDVSLSDLFLFLKSGLSITPSLLGLLRRLGLFLPSDEDSDGPLGLLVTGLSKASFCGALLMCLVWTRNFSTVAFGAMPDKSLALQGK